MESLQKSERRGGAIRSAGMGGGHTHSAGSAYSRWYTSTMLIHSEQCGVEIALDAWAPPPQRCTEPASVLLNASESFRSVTALRECVCGDTDVRLLLVLIYRV